MQSPEETKWEGYNSQFQEDLDLKGFTEVCDLNNFDFVIPTLSEHHGLRNLDYSVWYRMQLPYEALTQNLD